MAATAKTLAKVLAITKEYFDIPADLLHADKSVSDDDIGFDAIDLTDLLLELEDQLGIEDIADHLDFNEDDIGSLTLRQIADAVEEQLAER